MRHEHTQLEARPWTTHAATTIVTPDETVVTGVRIVAETEDESMARLFAAAPELLEALEVALRDMESTRAHFAMHAPNTGVLAISIGLARAAIAKATGGQP